MDIITIKFGIGLDDANRLGWRIFERIEAVIRDVAGAIVSDSEIEVIGHRWDAARGRVHLRVHLRPLGC